MKSQDIIKSALRLIGVYASGESLDAAMAQDALVVAQQLVDSWNSERLQLFTIQIYEFTPLANQQTYTVGLGGDVNIARPPRIESISVVTQVGSTQPLELSLGSSLSDKDWQEIPVKNITSSFPQRFYDDGAFPLRSISFWPIANTGVHYRFYNWSQLVAFADLSATDYTFPPAYLRALRYNLAVELATEFSGNPALYPAVEKIAFRSKAKIKAMNTVTPRMQCDEALIDPRGGLYNWLTDETGPR